MSMLAASGGGSSAVGPTSGSKTYAYNNINTTPGTVINPNPQRVAVSFHNPGSVSIYVYPVLVQGLNTPPNSPTDQRLNPSVGALGGTYLLNAGVTLVFTGETQKAWGAFSASGSNNPLTVAESNIS